MNSINKPIRFLFLLFMFSAGFLAAQKPCITLDTLPKDKVFGAETKLKPGATVFTQFGTSFQLAAFKTTTIDSVQFGNVNFVPVSEVFNGAFKLGSKRVAFVSNINLLLTFPNYTEKKVKRICLSFYDGGGVENIAINGEPIKVIKSFSELNGLEIAKGVKATVTRDTTVKTGFLSGYLCLEGNITSLTIGGQELALDNFCIEGDDSTDGSKCSFNGFKIAPRPCNTDGSFLADFGFQIVNPGKNGYYITVGNQTFGPYKYTAPFPVLGPIKPNSAGEYEFVISDADNKDCNEDFKLSGWKCNPINTCILSGTKAEIVFCQKDSSSYLTITLPPTVTPTLLLDTFKISVDGKTVGIFGLRLLAGKILLPRKLYPNNKSVLVICSTKNPNCCFDATIEISNSKDCSKPEDCSFKNLGAERRPCGADGTFLIDFKFEKSGSNGAGYTVTVNDQVFGPYRYSTFPVLGPVKGNSAGQYLITVRDIDNKNCAIDKRFTDWTCLPAPCWLSSLKPYAVYCAKDSSSYLEITSPIVFVAPVLDTFKVSIDGKFFAYLNYTQLLSKIYLPKKNYTGGQLRLVVCSTKTPTCCFESEVKLVVNKDCSAPSDCNLKNLVLAPRPCTPNGVFYLDLKFEHSSITGKNGYYVLVDNQTFGPFKYKDNFPVIGPIKANATGDYLVSVRDADDKNCATDKRITGWKCNPLPCLLTGIKAEINVCGKDSSSVLEVNLVDLTPGVIVADTFKVVINGKLIGYFNYKQLQEDIKLPKLANLGKLAKIAICAARAVNCCWEAAIEVNYDPSCNGEEEHHCSIRNLVAKPTECGPEGKFFIKLDFEAEKTSKKGYQVLVNGAKFGPYPYVSPIALVGPIKADSVGNYTVEVIDLDSTGCRDTAYIENFRCKSCPAIKLSATYTLCRKDGRPTLYFNASTDIDLDSPFLLQVNGETIGEFHLNEDHTFVLPKVYEAAKLRIKICIPHFPNCCAEIDAFPSKRPCIEDHETCLEFEDLPIGQEYSAKTGFKPGAKIFTEDDVIAYIDELKGAKAFGKISVARKVDPAMFPQAKGQSLYVNNATLRLDFSKIKGSVKQLCFDFFDGSLIRNIAINGKMIGPFKKLSDLKIDSLFKGFTIYFTPSKDPNYFLENGTLCIKGDIKSFAIGGEELLVDNFCFTSIDTIKQCDLGLKVKTVDCVPGSSKYYAQINVTNNGLAKSYSVKAPDGKTYGPYAFDKPSPVIGPFVLASTSARQVFVAYDTNNPSCADTFLVQKLDCPVDTCVLTGIKAVVKSCAPNGGYNIVVNVAHTPLPSSIAVFYLSIDGKTYGPYKFASLPLLLENIPVSSKDTLFEVAAFLRLANVNCRVNVKVKRPVCPPACNISDLKVVDVKCDDNGKTYSMTVSMKTTGTDSVFYLKTGEGFEYKFRSKDLPVRISGITIPKSGVLDYILVCSTTSNDCCAKWQYEVPCATPACILKAIKAQAKDCNPKGNYNVLVNLDYIPTPSGPKEFYIYIEGKVYGPYKFANLPVLVENVVSVSKDTLVEIAAFIDGNSKACRVLTKLAKPNCTPACNISDFKVSDVECVSTSKYNMTLNLKAVNTDSILLLKTSAGGEYKIRVKSLPIRLTGIPTPKNGNVDYFTICSANSKDCCAEWKYELPCQPVNCNIGPIKVEQTCLPNGTYYLTLNFDHKNTSSTFQVSFNGQTVGEYAYSKLPIRLGPLTRTGTAEIKVEDKVNKCEAALKTELKICETSCSIKELVAKALPCNNGLFYIETTVRSTPADSIKTYVIYADGQIYGPFKYSKAVQQIGPFKGNGFTIYDVLAIDISNPTCFGYAKVGPVYCDAPCTIGKLNVQLLKCVTDSTRRVLLDFSYLGANNRTFTVSINNKPVGTYPLSKLPLEETFKFPGSASQDKYKITVCVNDQKECCLSGEFSLPCKQGLNTDVWPGDANADRIANHIDLIHIGVAFGFKGAKRSAPAGAANAMVDWAAKTADDWALSFPNGLNFKHADCNGDGVIDQTDIDILRKNYGYTHGTLLRPDTLPYTTLDPDIRLELPTVGKVPQGAKIDIPIILGSEVKRVKNIYGLAFAIKVDPKLINLSNVEVVVPTSWLGEPKVNMESIYKIYPKEGIIEMALTRIDQNEVSGYGPIAYLRIIKDDIVGRQASVMQVTDPRGIQMDGNELPLGTSRLLIEAAPSIPVPVDEQFSPVVQVYPNPVDDVLRVATTLSTPISQLQVFGIDGKVFLAPVNNSTEINVGALASGVYILRIQSGSAIFHQRFIKK